MTEKSLSERLANLEQRIQELLDAYGAIKKERDALNAENNGLKIEIEGLSEQIASFQNQDKITKIVSSTTVEKEEATELKYKLNEYIREIDRCIAHLSQ